MFIVVFPRSIAQSPKIEQDTTIETYFWAVGQNHYGIFCCYGNRTNAVLLLSGKTWNT